jgi:hypothetical protein
MMWETSHCDAWGMGMSENGKAPQIGRAEIEALVSRGFLGPGDREDTIAIEFGLSAFIDETLGAL